MISSPDDRRAAITPQLAVRVAVLGGVALTLFAIVFFRLWFLQVLSGDQYVAEAGNNRERKVQIDAPRGRILDRDGTVLVDNRRGIAVQIDPQKLPALVTSLVARYQRAAAAAPRGRAAIPPLPDTADGRRLAALYARLGRVIGRAPERIHREVIEQVSLTPYAKVTLRSDASRAMYAYLLERGRDFPAVSVDPVYVRTYPYRELAAQLFGPVGEITRPQLGERRFRGVTQGTRVGQGGIESQYDRYLRGTPGASRVQVDSLGRPNEVLAQLAPRPGRNLRLSLDLGLQREGQRAVARAMGLARANGNPARGGAFVALDPRNGEVLALGSEPSFNANVFARPISQRRYAALNDPASGYPLFDRAIAGAYPTGSTFKLITATAGLQAGLITPDTPVNDPGEVQISNITFKNAGSEPHGTIALRRALQVSSDVFFYKLGAQANGARGQVIQSWARRLGLGHPTGIDLPGERAGLVPDRAWRDGGYERYVACKQRGKGFCGYLDRPWSIGDNVNLAVGQGDVQASPLQMAVAYAALANGGRVVRPHLGLEVDDRQGRVLQKLTGGAPRRVDIAPGNRQAILDGLRLAASAPGGTSADVFKGWPARYPVYGKTGTAERPGQADQSWYVCFVPDRRRPIVIAVTIEKGGFGAEAAAPAARLMLSQWFGVRKKVVVGRSRTR